MAGIEAIYIFDQDKSVVLSHTWRARPPAASDLVALYLAQPEQGSFMYETSTTPATLIHATKQDGLLFLCTTSTDTDPLMVLEFQHRVIDALEDFLGSPLLASKMTASCAVVAQILVDMCDCGAILTTEPNALRDLVHTSSMMKNLLGGVGLPTTSPSLSLIRNGAPSMSSLRSLAGSPATAPTIPWRRANVRHTSNELYVDIVETLHLIAAPSGHPLAAFAHGSIVFTAKVSGIPDLLLSLTCKAGGSNALVHTLSLPVFHPCVRLARWKERAGELSFVPPDGRFVLMGYQVDLLDPHHLDQQLNQTGKRARSNLRLPASVSIRKNLGPIGADFQVHLAIDPSFASQSSASGSRADAFARVGAIRNSGTLGHPMLEHVSVRVPIPAQVRSLGDMKASKGEARWTPGETHLEWHLSSRALSAICASANIHSSNQMAVATLHCSISGPGPSPGADLSDEPSHQDSDGLAAVEMRNYSNGQDQTSKQGRITGAAEKRRRDANKALMPTSATLSFQVRGWLASGIKVDKLIIDERKSRGLGVGMQPYKGVKYVTASQDGIEIRC